MDKIYKADEIVLVADPETLKRLWSLRITINMYKSRDGCVCVTDVTDVTVGT